MGRWAPGADRRLQAAALELFADRGYEQTTVADIAERAGVTSRTFFRHFADKREVLFSGSTSLIDVMVEAMGAAPEAATPLALVRRAVDAITDLLGADHDHASRRFSVISAHPELQERELIKMAGFARSLAGALRDRDIPDPQATLAAEAGIAVFRTAYERWVGDAESSLSALVDEGFATIAALS